jgi:hypothetical protein
MRSRGSDSIPPHSEDKQLQDIDLQSVLAKRRLDQALNVKEFAVCAGLSYSTARAWFNLPGFPAIRGVVFWQDFVQWRTQHHGSGEKASHPEQNGAVPKATNLPPRAEHILRDF